MSPATLTGVVLDLGAVLGWCRRDPYPHAIAWATAGSGNTIVVPAAVLSAARALVPADQLDILAALLGMPHTVVPVLDLGIAADVGVLLTGHPDADTLVSAAHAVHEAVSRNWSVLTDRAMVLQRLHAEVQADTIP
ncbi:hypothetical protein ACFQZZ_17870 [Nocardia sp. GCM10030253]|uniref:hypothetical protein n=1 Tax=Nocardia sp. GCM10030253 TaxID=3273404 RepID=UPI00363F2D19